MSHLITEMPRGQGLLMCVGLHHLGIRGRPEFGGSDLGSSLTELAMSAVYFRGCSFDIAQSLFQISNHLFTLFAPDSRSMKRVEQGIDFAVRTLSPRFKLQPHRLLLV